MGNVINLVGDSLRSFVNKMGFAGYDKAAAGSSEYVPLVLSDKALLDAYRATWLAKKIVNVPAFDSVRAWRNWQAPADQITRIEAEESRLDLRRKIFQALVKARLFGGSVIMLGTGDTDLMEPLDVERITAGGLKYLTVLTKRQITDGTIDDDPSSEWFGRPSFYSIPQKAGTPVNIHPSRLIIFIGEEVADPELVSFNRGWGDSVLTSVMQSIKNADATCQNIASLVFEAKVDVFKIPGLMQSLTNPEYEERLINRISLASRAKGIGGALLMDADELYEQKTVSFAQLPEVLQSFLQVVSGAADIPVTRLLGQSPAGMNATGESDIRNYYDRINSTQTVHLTPTMHRLDEAIIRSALGNRPPDLFYIWSSLWQTSAKENAEIGERIANTIDKLNATSLFPKEALAKAGANMLIEAGIMPGFDDEIEEAGGYPDFEAELEEAEERAKLAAEASPAANSNVRAVKVANDGQTRVLDATPRTLYMRRDVVNTDAITAWAKEQGFETVVDDLHVTVVYSKEAFDWMKMGEPWGDESDGNMALKAGGPRAMERFGDAIVLAFSSSALQWRHGDARHAGASHDYEEYQPHITITYQGLPEGKMIEQIEPYRGPITLGPEIYEEIDLFHTVAES